MKICYQNRNGNVWCRNSAILLFYDPITSTWAGISQSVSRLATGWTIRGSNTGGDRRWSPPNLLYNGHRVFPRGKAVRAWHWPHTTSSTEVKERVELYIYSPSGPSWPLLGWNLPFTSTFKSTYKYAFCHNKWW